MFLWLICFALPVTEVVWEGQQLETIVDGNASKKSDEKIVSDAVDR